MTIKKFSAVLLALSFVITPMSAVFARTTTTTYLPALSQWTRSGSTSVGSESVTLTGGSQGWVFVDIDARRVNGSYLAVAAFANKSDTRSWNSSQNRSSGNPYLYAYLMDANKRIKKYITADTTTSSSRNDSDRVVYGIFPIESDTSTIRVFLMQSSMKDVSNYGANVTFTNPVLLSASTNASVQTLVNAYAQGTLDLTQTNTPSSSASLTSTSTTTSSTDRHSHSRIQRHYRSGHR